MESCVKEINTKKSQKLYLKLPQYVGLPNADILSLINVYSELYHAML